MKESRVRSGGLQGLVTLATDYINGSFFFHTLKRGSRGQVRITGSSEYLKFSLTSYILGWQMEHFTSQCLEHLTTYIWEQCQVAVSRLQLLEALVTVHAGLAWHDSGEE